MEKMENKILLFTLFVGWAYSIYLIEGETKKLAQDIESLKSNITRIH